MIIDIHDLDPVLVLQALFENAKQQQWGLAADFKPSLVYSEAKLIYDNHQKNFDGFIDWLCGRPIKVSFHD